MTVGIAMLSELRDWFWRTRRLFSADEPAAAAPDIDVLRSLPFVQRGSSIAPEAQASSGWHSWDPHPWLHPWLTPRNLRGIRDFSKRTIARLRAADDTNADGYHFGFVGNLANNMTLRALPLRRCGVKITIYLHPADRYVMSQPGWEISDVVLPDGEMDVDRLAARGVHLPIVPDTIRLPPATPTNPMIRAASDTPASE